MYLDASEELSTSLFIFFYWLLNHKNWPMIAFDKIRIKSTLMNKYFRANDQKLSYSSSVNVHCFYLVSAETMIDIGQQAEENGFEQISFWTAMDKYVNCMPFRLHGFQKL